MMKIKVFGKKSCAKCETTKNKISHFIKKNEYEDKVSLEFQDMDTVEGMAEGAYYDVLKVPTSIVERGSEVIARWDGEVPKTEDFSKLVE
jgi:hypothetical protein